jgi:peptidoglycan/LPS O-acetylase OafA/YrhL
LKNVNNLSFENNFDLLRLLAALQVMYYHIFEHFIPPNNEKIYNLFFRYIVDMFPGVPIFFMISGFLIFWSYDRNSNAIRRFFLNRIKRIFPALWLCTLITIILLTAIGGIAIKPLFIPKIVLWIVGQLSFFQFWTPDIFKSFGLGNPNGVLATISVELQFYLAVPIIFILSQNQSKIKKNIVILSITLVSYLFNQFSIINFSQETLIFKFIAVSLFPYLFYFCIGILFYINFDLIKGMIASKFTFWLLVFLSYNICFSWILRLYSSNYFPGFFGLIYTIILGFLIFSFAFSFRTLGSKVLKTNDFSYGIYIYHGLLLNIFVGLNLNSQDYIVYFSLLTFLFSYISWNLIEKRFVNINLKKKTINFNIGDQ